MTRILIPIIFSFSFLAHAEDVLWSANKLTPAQPFPGRVLAVESSWVGYKLFIESLGDGDKRYCMAQVGMGELAYSEIPKGSIPQPSVSTVFLNPPIEIDHFSWSLGPWRIGRIFGDEDCLKNAITALEPIDRRPLAVPVPAGAVQVWIERISFPLAHKAKHANLLFKKTAGKNDYCVIRPEEARDIAGKQFKDVDGLKAILVKWSFHEPVDESKLDWVSAKDPVVYTKDDILYVSSTGINIEDVGKVVDGVIIVQVSKLPKSIVHKLSHIGW